MNKKNLIDGFTSLIERELSAIEAAARATLEAATHPESKAENKYDTRGLEASYLAGAQAKRVSEMQEVLGLFRTLAFKDLDPDDPVQSTALVEVNLDGKKNILLLMPKGGGVQITHDGENVQIVTPASSLGEALLGLHVNEHAEFEVGNKIRRCEILKVQ